MGRQAGRTILVAAQRVNAVKTGETAAFRGKGPADSPPLRRRIHARGQPMMAYLADPEIVPEPSSVALALTGLLLAGASVFARRHRVSQL
jgi:hypothetical protein